MRNHTLQAGNVALFCTGNTLPNVAMHDRTRRALAAVAEMDRRRIPLCPTCEGLLLTAASGLPLPMIRDGDGLLIGGELHVDAVLDRILADRAVG